MKVGAFGFFFVLGFKICCLFVCPLPIPLPGVTVLFKVGIYLVDVSLRNENTKTCPTMYETCQKLRSTPRSFLAEEPLLKGLKHIDLRDADLLREHKIQAKKHRKAKSKSA